MYSPANLFSLQRRGALAIKRPLSISYSTTGIDGQPHLSVTDKNGTRSFRGDEIRVQETEVGMLVSVTLEVVPDAWTKTLTILLPQVNVATGAVTFTTQAITTTSRTSIGGPMLVAGALESWTYASMSGSASAVVF